MSNRRSVTSLLLASHCLGRRQLYRCPALNLNRSMHWSTTSSLACKMCDRLLAAPSRHYCPEQQQQQQCPLERSLSRTMATTATASLGLRVYSSRSGDTVARHATGLSRASSSTPSSLSLQQFRFLAADSASRLPPNVFDDDDGDHQQPHHCWRCDAPVNVSGRILSEENFEALRQTKESSSTSNTSNDKRSLECAHCGALLPLGVRLDHFSLFSLSPTFEIDLVELKRRYLRLQQAMHPDRNVNRDQTENLHAQDNSSIINAAYKTLRDPYQRALYLLKLLYNIAIDEENVDTDPDMLLEIMELNEDIELASSDHDGMLDMVAKLENDLTALQGELKDAFAYNNASAVRRLVIRYSYCNSALSKLKQSLDNLSK